MGMGMGIGGGNAGMGMGMGIGIDIGIAGAEMLEESKSVSFVNRSAFKEGFLILPWICHRCSAETTLWDEDGTNLRWKATETAETSETSETSSATKWTARRDNWNSWRNSRGYITSVSWAHWDTRSVDGSVTT